MRAELYRPDDPDDAVAVATWSPDGPSVEVRDPSAEHLDRLLRPTPVVVEDASLRSLGAHGEAMLHPGSLEWFRAALLARAPELGLAVRFVRDHIDFGWDPASAYRTFEQQMDRLASS
ncbi:MAG TPA: hypothetical protein VF029_06605 [Actinomycetota bacterium]